MQAWKQKDNNVPLISREREREREREIGEAALGNGKKLSLTFWYRSLHHPPRHTLPRQLSVRKEIPGQVLKIQGKGKTANTLMKNNKTRLEEMRLLTS